MKRRLRGITKWGGMTLCVLLFALWLSSGWWSLFMTFSWPQQWLNVWLGRGSIGMLGPGEFVTPPRFVLAHLDRRDYEWNWWEWSFSTDSPWVIIYPGWLPFLLIAFLPAGFSGPTIAGACVGARAAVRSAAMT